jgi:hypothetical protein
VSRDDWCTHPQLFEHASFQTFPEANLWTTIRFTSVRDLSAAG